MYSDHNIWLMIIWLFFDAFCMHFVFAKNVPSISAIVGGKVALTCNISTPMDDSVILILWYKGDTTGAPIYSVDRRYTDSLLTAEHFQSKTLDNRAMFDISSRPFSLLIDPIKEEDDGLYFCRIDFRWSRTISVPIMLHVIVPPEKLLITNENGVPFRNTAGPFNEGEDAVLQCFVKGGKPRPLVHWYKDGQLIDDQSDSNDNGSYVINTLIIARLQRSHLYTSLTCQVDNNHYSSISLQNTVTLEMNLKPVYVQITSATRQLKAGQRVEIVCQTYGSRPPAQITWILAGKTLQYSRETYAEEGNYSTSVLELVPTSENNASLLVCKAENHRLPNSSLEDSCQLNVLYKPITYLMVANYSQKRKLISLKEESGLKLECIVTANPPIKDMFWFFNDKPLKFGQFNDIKVTNRTLEIRELKRTHEGSYKCMASNSEGTTHSDTLKVEILFAPICESNETIAFSAKFGDKIEIVCEVAAKPNKLVFQWSVMDSELISDDDITYTTLGEKSYLLVKANKMSHFRNYTCKARNSVGWQREPCVFRIHPSGVPKSLQSCITHNKTNSTLHVECDHDSNKSMADYFILEVYDTSDQRLVSILNESIAPRFRVNGLQSNTSYVLVLYAVNENGRSNNVVLTVITKSFASRSDSLEISGETGTKPLSIYSFFSAFSVILITATIILSVLVVIICKITHQMRSKRRRNCTAKLRDEAILCNARSEVKTPDIIPLSLDIPGLEPTKKVILNGPLRQILDTPQIANGLLNYSPTYSDEPSVSGFVASEASTIKEERFAQNYRSTPV